MSVPRSCDKTKIPPANSGDKKTIPPVNSTPDLDLFNLQIHQSENDLEILSHRKTQKLISTDINSLIRGSASPVRGEPTRHLRNGRKPKQR